MPRPFGLSSVACELEPHETVHCQNRAALFTLLRENDAYHDAWFELDRRQYRLALLGRITGRRCAGDGEAPPIVRPAGAAPGRGTGRHGKSSGTGIPDGDDPDERGASETILAVNNDRIEDDPDLLRQWIHHRRAELTFAHWALGLDPRRFLLDPDHLPGGAGTACQLWPACARSLGVLVPEEGRLLAGRLVAAWMRQAGQYRPRLHGAIRRLRRPARSNFSTWRHSAISPCSASRGTRAQTGPVSSRKCSRS